MITLMICSTVLGIAGMVWHQTNRLIDLMKERMNERVNSGPGDELLAQVHELQEDIRRLNVRTLNIKGK